MNFTTCPLYGIQTKKRLASILHVRDSRMFNQNHLASLIHPFIDYSRKPRLIEAPSSELKAVQRRIKTLLGLIDVPKNVFSGVKGRSHIDNAKCHLGSVNRYLYKTDFTAFFPSISRDVVYRFFNEDLKCSADVSSILTSMTTVDLRRSCGENFAEIAEFLAGKSIKQYNHLISGAPTSQILSYLVNYKMFDDLQKVSDKNSVGMSIYVDDLTFSSEHAISHKFRSSVLAIIKKYNYQVSKNKVKGYSKSCPKLVTGVIIDREGKTKIKNSLHKKIIDEYTYLHANPTMSRSRLLGLINAARQIDKKAYPNIRRFALESPDTE